MVTGGHPVQAFLARLKTKVNGDDNFGKKEHTVGVVWEQHTLALAAQNAVGGGVYTLHLVEHHALQPPTHRCIS